MGKYSELVEKALELLKEENTFVDLCEQQTRYKGFLQEELFEMCELDDLFYGIKLTEFLDKIASDFNHADKYFYWDKCTGYVTTTSENKFDKYMNETDEEELFDNIKDNWRQLYLDNELEEIFEELEEIEEAEEITA